MTVQKTGLVAVFETEEFQKGLNEYTKGLGAAGKATDKAEKSVDGLSFDKAAGRWRTAGGQFASVAERIAAGVGNVGEKTEGIQGVFRSLGSQLSGLTKEAGPFAGVIGKAGGALSSLASATPQVLALGAAFTVTAGLVAVAVIAITGGVALVIKGIKEFITMLANAAAEAPKLEGIGLAFENNARRFNVSLQEMRSAAAGTISDFELMRQANVALTGASGEFAQQFGQQLPALLEGARAAAKATGQDVDFLFESLVSGVKRSSPLLIDNTGIVLKLGEANTAMAESLGIAVEDLTEEEKQLALLNATVAASIELSEQMGGSQRTAAENTAAAEASLKNMQDTLGQFMIPVITKLSGVWANFTSALSESVQEGGFLFPLITEIAARLSILADVAAFVANSLINGFKRIASLFAQFGGEISTNINDLIVEFGVWGAEMIAALADGIIKGASTVLTVAMDQISNMLAFWFAPGSPPRVAPNIDKWGAATFTEYMKGFSDADFGVLKGLQGVLGKILDKPELQELTLDIGTAIGEGGPDEAFFSKLGQAAGEFGTEVVDLARNYFELAEAQSQAEMAQTQLNDAMKAMSDAEISVNNLTRQYNELLRAGASDEVLAAQMKQIQAAEKQLVLAQEQKSQAEENKRASEERLQTLEEETGLQEELVDQLLALAEEEQKAAATGGPGERPEGAGAGAGGITREAAGLGAGIGGAMGEGITTGIQDAIENAKKLLLEKLGKIFAPLKKRWEESIKPTLEGLLERFQEFRDDVAVAWEELQERIQPVIDTLVDWWEVKIPDAIDEIRRVIDVTLMPAFRKVWNFVKDNLIPKLRELAEDIFGKLETAIENIKEFLTGENGLVAAFAALRSFILDKLISTFDNFRKTYVEPLVTAFENLKSALDAVNRIAQIIKQTIEWILDNDVGDPFEGDVNPGTSGTRGVDVTPVIVNVPPMATATAGAQTTNQFNVGGNTITDGMDAASFEARVIQIIRRELGG